MMAARRRLKSAASAGCWRHPAPG